MYKKHAIIREKENIYSLNCPIVNRKWPFDPPMHRVVMICPICNQTSLDITPAENDNWIITEDKE